MAVVGRNSVVPEYLVSYPYTYSNHAGVPSRGQVTLDDSRHERRRDGLTTSSRQPCGSITQWLIQGEGQGSEVPLVLSGEPSAINAPKVCQGTTDKTETLPTLQRYHRTVRSTKEPSRFGGGAYGKPPTFGIFENIIIDSSSVQVTQLSFK